MFQKKTKIIFYTVDSVIAILTMIYLLSMGSGDKKNPVTVICFILFCLSLMFLVEAFVFKLYKKYKQGKRDS